MTQKHSSDFTKYVLDPYISKPFANLWAQSTSSADASRAAAAALAESTRNRETGDSVIRAALGGLGVGLSGTRLYRLIQSMNKPKDTHVKFGPGAKKIDDGEKIAGSIADTLKQLYADTTHSVGSAINSVDPALRVPAVLGSSVLGLYGGAKLINSIENQKQKEEQAEMVEDAKKEYQRALMGKKHAAAFDAAFATFTEKTAWPSALEIARMPLDLLRVLPYGDTLASAYATGTLGAGALAGKMTYDWTRHRSRDKALERARKSRARIEGAAPLYVDPEQLAAIKKIAD